MTFEVTDDLLAACKTFVRRLHQAQSTRTGVNKLIFELFATKAAQCDQLPPTGDALGLHVAWANYQAGIWRRALQSKPVVLSPCGHGWYLSDDGMLSVKWITILPARDDLLILVACGCLTGCVTARCSCVRAGLECSDACLCESCENLDINQGAASDESADEGCADELEDECEVRLTFPNIEVDNYCAEN